MKLGKRACPQLLSVVLFQLRSAAGDLNLHGLKKATVRQHVAKPLHKVKAHRTTKKGSKSPVLTEKKSKKGKKWFQQPDEMYDIKGDPMDDYQELFDEGEDELDDVYGDKVKGIQGFNPPADATAESFEDIYKEKLQDDDKSAKDPQTSGMAIADLAGGLSSNPDEVYVQPFMMTVTHSGNIAAFDCVNGCPNEPCKKYCHQEPRPEEVFKKAGQERGPLYILPDQLVMESGSDNKKKYDGFDMEEEFCPRGQACITVPYLAGDNSAPEAPGIPYQYETSSQLKGQHTAIFPICMYAAAPTSGDQKAYWQVNFPAGLVRLTRVRIAFNKYADGKPANEDYGYLKAQAMNAEVRGGASDSEMLSAAGLLGTIGSTDFPIKYMDSSYSDYIDSNMVWYRGFDAKKGPAGGSEKDAKKMYEMDFRGTAGTDAITLDRVRIVSANVLENLSICGFQAFIHKIPAMEWTSGFGDFAEGKDAGGMLDLMQDTVVMGMKIFPNIDDYEEAYEDGPDADGNDAKIFFDNMRGLKLLDQDDNVLAEYRGRVQGSELSLDWHLMHKTRYLKFSKPIPSPVTFQLFIDARTRCNNGLPVDACGFSAQGADVPRIYKDNAQFMVCPGSYTDDGWSPGACQTSRNDHQACCMDPPICQDSAATFTSATDFDPDKWTVSWSLNSVCSTGVCDATSDKAVCVVPRMKCRDPADGGMTNALCAARKGSTWTLTMDENKYCKGEKCLMAADGYPADGYSETDDENECCSEFQTIPYYVTLTVAQVTDTFDVLNGDPDGNFFCNGDPNDPDNDGQKAALVTYLNGIYTGLGMTPERVICEAQEESTDSNVLLELKKELKKESVSVASSEGVLESKRATLTVNVYLGIQVKESEKDDVLCVLNGGSMCSSLIELHRGKKKQAGGFAAAAAAAVPTTFGVVTATVEVQASCGTDESSGSEIPTPDMSATMTQMMRDMVFEFAGLDQAVYEKLVCENRHGERVAQVLKVVSDELNKLE